MAINSITFENYKAFLKSQKIKIRPITMLIGKNSSGKSSIAKLFPLLENSLSGNIHEPLLLKNNGVELGAEFKDLTFGRQPIVPIKLGVELADGTTITVEILQERSKYDLTISEWSIDGPQLKIHLTYIPEKGYIDKAGQRYDCIFRGFIPQYLIDENGHDLIQHTTIRTALPVDYIGPFRILPERVFYLTGQISYKNIGIKGEHAYSMLGVSKLQKDELNEKVGSWYKLHFDGWELVVDDKNKPYIEIKLVKEESEVNIVDVGQGMNQALPLIVRSNIFVPGSITIIEQPELHLHPAAHGDLAELFARSSKEGRQNFIIETHSENILLRYRKLIVENDFGFNHDDLVIYWISKSEDGGQEVEEITVDEFGVLSGWPDGVFNENIAEIIEMQKAVKKKQKS